MSEDMVREAKDTLAGIAIVALILLAMGICGGIELGTIPLPF